MATLAVVSGSAALVVFWPDVATLAPAGPSAARVRSFVAGFGPYAPAAFVALQAVQVVLAPVPGQLLAGVGGYLFGGLYGTVLSVTGVVAGSLVVFGLARRYGRPAVERLLGDGFDAFQRFGADHGPLALFVFFLLPAFPDDLLCAVAGLWDVRLRTFLAVLVVGRTPSFLVVAYAGTAVESGALGRATVLLVAVALVSLGVYAWRDRVEARLGGADPPDGGSGNP